MRRRRDWRFYLGLPPFGFYPPWAKPFPSKEDYLEMLRGYKEDLEDELREIEKEIEDIKNHS